MTQNIIIDTHTHTKASDGTFTPTESVVHAKSVGLEVLAKTDHDTIWGNDEAVAAGKQYGVKVIPGIEIDAEYLDSKSGAKVKDIELLGLNVNKSLWPFVEKLGQNRMNAMQSFIDNFNAYINSESFTSQNANSNLPLVKPQEILLDNVVSWYNAKMQFDNPFPFMSKVSFLDYVVENMAEQNDTAKLALQGDRNAMGEFKTAYKFLLNKKTPKTTFYKALDAVKSSGGTAVIAHPGLSKGYLDGMVKEWEQPTTDWFQEKDQLTPYAFISDLAEHGLDGIEQYFYAGSDKAHANQQELINEYFGAMAEKLGLLVTYGSDCHGEKGKGPLKGKFGGTQDYSHLL